MRFKPFSSTYDFSKAELTEDYPNHIRTPIMTWISDILSENSFGYSRGYSGRIETLKPEFVNRLSVLFRLEFSRNLSSFLSQIMSNSDLTSNFLALMLQNYATGDEAVSLEIILSDGGSAFAVEKTDNTQGQYAPGVYDLVKRVPKIIADEAKPALESSELLQEAWRAFYSRNPDYEKTVNKCCDALEHLLKEHYEPKNPKPQLGLMIKNLQTTPEKLNFKGDTLLDNKAAILELISKATVIRGSHTAGTGRKPTPREAEFILHSSILIFNIHSRA